LAGNGIQGADSNGALPGTQDPMYYLNQAIDWLQMLTPDENNLPIDAFGDQGDGYLRGLNPLATTLNNASPVVPSSSPYWNSGINNSDANTTNDYPGSQFYHNTYDGPVLAGNTIHMALDEYNNTGMINGVFYAPDGDSIL